MRKKKVDDAKVVRENEGDQPAETEGGEAAPSTDSAPPEGALKTGFPIVGIGASAGGLAAFEEFFRNMPPNTESGMAFVLVQHLDPDHKSILTDLLKRYTTMEVRQVSDGMKVEPGCAYIIPPNKDMAFMQGRLHLMQPTAPRGVRLPIDYFFRSLAQDQRERAICIVLSGTGTDGTLGLKEVKGAGGMTMVQDPQTASYDGMPRSAMATGKVDYVLSPEKMPGQIIAYVRHAFAKHTLPALSSTEADDGGSLQKIFVLIRGQTGHDFSLYKANTVGRRIERRMAVAQIEDINDYVSYLQRNPLEIETLFRELLIGVTSFFRDPEAFQSLAAQAIQPLLNGRDISRPLRIWIPGCSTGEEAYSISMLLHEAMDTATYHRKIQIFATDLDTESLDQARVGIYPDSIAADVSPERLARFFNLEGSTYQIKKSIRDTIVFAIQNVISDPPFSKIDLISCRNLLIYMGSELQKKAVPLFHYSLNPDGFLFLGSSETIGEFVNLFEVVDRKWKLFQRKRGPSPRLQPDFALPSITDASVTRILSGLTRPGTETNIRDLTERILLDRHAPGCAVVNEKGDVLYIHGRTGRYLEPASGEASLNILRMAREGLRLELTAALRKVLVQKIPIHRPGLKVKTNGDYATVDLQVQYLTDPAPMHGLIMVTFREPEAETQPPVESGVQPEPTQRLPELERELRLKEEYLQTTIEELETSNEELTSTNEELQSANEELQSSNEELETSREELQSVNEELVTVNVELQQKIDELSRVNNDMNNLMASTGVGTVFLDNDLLIQRFTPTATDIINLISSDVGRPLTHIASNLEYASLTEDARQVLKTLASREVEVRSKDGRWYLMRIQPYRTVHHAIEGVVITFVDINMQKAEQEAQQVLAKALEDERDFVAALFDTVREPLLVLDGDMRVVSANWSFYQEFRTRPEDTEGRELYRIRNGEWGIPELRHLLEEILPEKTTFDDYRLTCEFKGIGKTTMALNAREVRGVPGEERRILLAIEVLDEAD